MKETLKKRIAKEWLLFILCILIGGTWYGLAWLYLLLIQTEDPYVRLWGIPVISISVYFLINFIRINVWAIKTIKKDK